MKNILFLLFSFFIIQSCVDGIDYTDKSNAPNVNKVLSKMKVNETGAVSYDVDYHWASGKLMSVSTSNNSFSSILQYNGNELIKIIAVSGQGSTVKNTTSTLIYTTGRLTQVNSIITSPSLATTIFTKKYTYDSNGKVTKVKYESANQSSPTVITGTWDVDLEYINSNISKVTVIFNNTTSISTFSQFDSNRNPFNTIPKDYNLASLNYDTSVDSGIEGLSPNNSKKSVLTFLGNTVNLFSVLNYDSDGYPSKITNSNGYNEYQYIPL